LTVGIILPAEGKISARKTRSAAHRLSSGIGTGGCSGRRSAFEGVKMIKAVSAGIAVPAFGFVQAGPDHLLGHLGVVGPFFFLLLAVHANRLMVVNRQNPPIIGLQGFIAPHADKGAVEIILPFIGHFSAAFPAAAASAPTGFLILFSGISAAGALDHRASSPCLL